MHINECKKHGEDIKLYFFGFIPSVFLVLLAFLIVNIYTYPLPGQNILAEMESKDVVSYMDEHGIIAYTVKAGNYYEGYVFTQSMFINRYKLYAQPEYNSTYTFYTPGKKNDVILELGEDSIQATYSGGSRLQIRHVALFLLMLICVNSFTYYCIQAYKSIGKKRAG